VPHRYNSIYYWNHTKQTHEQKLHRLLPEFKL